MNATIAGRSRPLPPDADFFAAAKLLLQCLRITKFAVVVSAVVLLWDILTTIDTEAEHVWHFRWSFTKVVFLINRYGTLAWFGWHLFLAFTPCSSERFCRSAQGLDVAGAMLLSIIQSTVFVSRVWVIYGRTRLPLLIIIAAYAVCALPAIAVVGWGFLRQRTSHAIQDYLSSLPEFRNTAIACNFTAYPPHIVAMFVASFVYETALFAAVAWKYFSGENHSGVLTFLYREEAVYYIIMMVTLAVAIVCCLLGPLGFAFVGSGYSVAVKSVLTSHMLLRLKTFLNADPSLGWRHTQTLGLDEETQIRFALPAAVTPDPRRRSETAASLHAWDAAVRMEVGRDAMEMVVFAVPHDGGAGMDGDDDGWVEVSRPGSSKGMRMGFEHWRPSASTSVATMQTDGVDEALPSSSRQALAP